MDVSFEETRRSKDSILARLLGPQGFGSFGVSPSTGCVPGGFSFGGFERDGPGVLFPLTPGAGMWTPQSSTSSTEGRLGALGHVRFFSSFFMVRGYQCSTSGSLHFSLGWFGGHEGRSSCLAGLEKRQDQCQGARLF